jgi:hypothetical protein
MDLQHHHNNYTIPPHMGVGPVCKAHFYVRGCCAIVVPVKCRNQSDWKMLFVLQVHNRGTTPPHMGVGPTHYNPPPCKGMLCPCCVPEVQITSPKVTRFTISY